MKKLAIVATLLLATTSAYAGNAISFEVNGHRIRIEAPRNCDSLSCLQISGISGSGFGSKSKRFDESNYDDDNNVTSNSDQPVTKSQPAPAVQAAAPVAQAPVQVAPAPAPVVAPAATAPAPVNAPVAPAVVASNSPAPAAGNDVAPAATPTTPVGIWSTEGNKGRVRVEPCGDNLCGYAVNSGEKILINMKPSDSKWTGRIHDPDSGRNYDSTITMKGPNALRVQGCAFGGMFCGGQTWSRVS
ncbi:DUF2147 domain-containing protein [Bradyrhizobium sp. dw_411]|uniref:DUF2147 domain-containing protein n=1 Tax=Bradyrhizobium sp. dw_411 TaxID=2720082 RepID=UPI001BCDEB4C|nr:DUF2147 domain-containing protein [Bradyrhizobium sp. dw_411]